MQLPKAILWSATLLGVVLLGVHAAEAQSSAADAAGEVLAAIRADDTSALRKLAGRADPDPWIVADALLAMGEEAAAEAFAHAAPGKAVERLPGYVALSAKTPHYPGARAVLRKAELDAEGGRYEAVLDALAKEPPGYSGVDLCRRHHLLAISLWRMKEPRQAGAAALAGAEIAARIGWLRMEAPNRQLFGIATSRQDPKAADRALERCLVIHRELESSAIGIALRNLANHRGRRDPESAVALYREAIDWFLDRSQTNQAAGAAAGLGGLHLGRREFDGARTAFARARDLFLEVGDGGMAAGMRINMGIVANRTGEVAVAVRAYEEGAAAAAAAGRPDFAWNGYSNLFEMYYGRGDSRRCLSPALRLMELAKTSGRRAMLHTAHMRLGYSYRAAGNLELSREQFESALSLAGGPVERYRVHLNLGGVMWETGRLDEALSQLERSAAAAERARDKSHLARAHVEIAGLLLGDEKPGDGLCAPPSGGGPGHGLGGVRYRHRGRTQGRRFRREGGRARAPRLQPLASRQPAHSKREPRGGPVASREGEGVGANTRRPPPPDADPRHPLATLLEPRRRGSGVGLQPEAHGAV